MNFFHSSGMSTVPNLIAALEYAQYWELLPLAWITGEGICGCSQGPNCHRPGKHPLVNGGLYAATREEAIIRGWWAKWPQANPGIRTGRESSLLVLDVDPRNGGSESLGKLKAQYGELPQTPTCVTGGGGFHFYFQYPGPVELRGKVQDFSGLDIKSDGGYVVAPPSRHHSGETYRWLVDWRTTAIAPLPGWLLDLIRRGKKVAAPRIKARTTTSPAAADMELSPEDQAILYRMEQGREGKQYQLLVAGDWEGGGYDSHSEADLALFNKLARLTRGEADRMYAIFKETELMRDETDKPPSYYQRTILTALGGLAWRPEAAGQKRRRRS